MRESCGIGTSSLFKLNLSIAAGGAEPASLWDPSQLEEHGEEALSGHSCGTSHVGCLEALGP